MRRYLIASSLILMFSAAGFAQPIYPMEQTRKIQGQVALIVPPDQSDSQSASANDMALWVDDVEAVLEGEFEGNTYGFYAGAGQYSDINAEYLSAFGTADVTVDAEYYDVGGSGRAENTYRVQFAVAEPVNYDIAGSIATYVDGEDAQNDVWEIAAEITVELDQIAGPLVYDASSYAYAVWDYGEPVSSESASLTDSGQLDPGVYELKIVTKVDVFDFYFGGNRLLYGEAAFVVDLAFSTPDPDPSCDNADLDTDGDVDILDFMALQECLTGP